MQMDLPNTATLSAAIGDGLAGLLIAHIFLLPIHAAALLASFIQRPRPLPSGFRTFLRAATYVHYVTLVLSVAYLGLLYARPELDLHGIGRWFFLWLCLLPSLLGLLLVRLLKVRTAPDAPLCLPL